MFTKGKYVSFGRLKNMVLFPETLSHKEMAVMLQGQLGEPQSAGFFVVAEMPNGPKFEAFGESTSLRIKSDPDDSRLMNSQFGLFD